MLERELVGERVFLAASLEDRSTLFVPAYVKYPEIGLGGAVAIWVELACELLDCELEATETVEFLCDEKSYAGGKTKWLEWR